MASGKPRILNDGKDMLWTLVPLVLACFAIAAIASQCSFSPGGPKSGPVPQFDVDGALKSDASSIGFPIRNPKVPDGWQANSGSRTDIAGTSGGKVTTVGYITPKGLYMQLTQSNASEDALVSNVIGQRTATGVEQIGSTKWVVYGEEGVEPAWVADFDQVRILIRGAGEAADFTALATAIGAARPLAP